MAYSIRLKPSAVKGLQRLPKSAQRQIVNRIEGLENDPHPAGSKTIKGSKGLLRIRSGDYRVVYTVRGKTVWILKIGDRKDIYRGLAGLADYLAPDG